MQKARVSLLGLLSLLVGGCTQPSKTERTPAPSKAELAHAFATLGADDPEGWARSEVEEGIPQLARFLVLREAWAGVASEKDVRWIDRDIQQAKSSPNAPLAGAGRALASMRARGVTDEEITDLVRAKQYEALFTFLYALDNPPQGVRRVPLANRVRWQLFEVDEESGASGRAISGLHVSLLETDPTRSEVHPRD